MKNQISKEELYHSLPDYISGNLNDQELSQAISNEIEVNPEFKTEFEEIEKTLKFLNSAEFSAPEDSYFNNLPVKINELISRETLRKSTWYKPGLVWKWLVPAMSVLLIAILLYNGSFQKADEVVLKQIEKSGTTSIENVNEETIKIPKVNQEDENLNQNTSNSTLKNTNLRRLKRNTAVTEVPQSIQIAEKPGRAEAILEQNMISANTELTGGADSESEDDILLMNEEYDNFEEELMEFTPEDRKNIIENLAKSQI